MLVEEFLNEIEEFLNEYEYELFLLSEYKLMIVYRGHIREEFVQDKHEKLNLKYYDIEEIIY